MPAAQLPDLEVAFVAEGAANIVYRPIVPTGHPITGKLLRLRKAIPSTRPWVESVGSFNQLIAPLLPEGTYLDPTLVALPPGFIEARNAELREAEGSNGARRVDRRGTYLAPQTEEPHGVLLEDMSSAEGEERITLEFKPKWLVQSPSAPCGAKRCRTCALRASRGERCGWCPFELVPSRNDAAKARSSIERALKNIVKIPGNPAVLEKAVDYLVSNDSILYILRGRQQQLDPNGVMVQKDESHVDPGLIQAMTLRDCTLFLRVDVPTGTVEAHLADLDIKPPENGKLAYWQHKERTLIHDGWYMGHDRICVLSR